MMNIGGRFSSPIGQALFNGSSSLVRKFSSKKMESTHLIALAVIKPVGESPKVSTPLSTSSKKIIALSSTSTPTAITEEKYLQTSKKVEELSRLHLLSRNAPSKMKELFSLENAKPPAYVDGTFYSWAKAPCKKVDIKEDGSINILNSDKRILINQLAHLIDKGIVVPEKKILLLNEGCDNGDFLGLVIPLLSNQGTNIKVLLVNGNEKKLKEATQLSSILLDGKDVTYLLHNSFESIPSPVTQFADHQMFHLFFRLAIVEKFDVIVDFIKKRIDVMKPNDVALASFLQWNALSMKTMCSHYSNTTKEANNDLGYIVLEGKTTNSAKKDLINRGTPEQNLNVYNTAFTKEAVADLIVSNHGEILQMTIIPTTTDAGHDINVIGVIFKKHSLSASK